ncbi:parallel beta-helix repeat (two copies) [Leptolyngbya sp. Heron Island J]|nr:parallel beta-helix repeat (two copies) [Leptolyngbya sp. Heron Island J]
MKSVQDTLLLLAMAAVITTLPANAQEPSNSSRDQYALSQGAQNYRVLHVDAAAGHDQQGVGSVEQPYRTITQALRMAPATSTVILLAPGHYSQESGEHFPLRLRPGLTIQGNAGETRNTIIAGGGEFQDSGTANYATIVTTDRSGLANVTVSNPKGSGVWITAGSPVLRRVALVSNAVSGVQVSNGAPVIENSYFHRNHYGLTIQGDGRAMVRGNYFEATGRAITVVSPATPIINNNRIARNDVGIALKNNARPLIEANVLDDNRRNGVVEVDTAVAVAPAAPANPTDVIAVKVAAGTYESNPPAAVAVQERAAVLIRPDAETVEPEVAEMETAVAVIQSDTDLNAAAEAVTVTTTPTAILEEITDVDEAVLDEAISDEAISDESISAIAPDRQQLAAASVAPAPVTTDRTAETMATDDAIPIAIVPVTTPDESTPHNSPSQERREGVAKLLARLNSSPVPDSSPPTATVESAPDVATPAAPAVRVIDTGERLPVPSVAIPSGQGSMSLTPPGTTVALAATFRYRVLVDMADAEALQSLVPDAFRTQVDDRIFMQAGAYVDEADAQERLDWLREHGIDGQVNLRN